MSAIDAKELASALSCLDPHNRDEWVAMAMACKAALGEDGFPIWDSWSQRTDSYNAKTARAVWKSVKAGGGVTERTLYHAARARGWQPSRPIALPSPEEQARIEAERAAARQKDEALQQAQRETAKAKAAKLWALGRDVSAGHPYLVSKGTHPYGVHQLRDMLLVPLRVDGELVNLQIIGSDGSKRFLTGGQVKGASLALGWQHDAQTVLLCEGWATGCTLHEATSLPVVVAFNAGNLKTVAERMAISLAESVQVLVCGDTDTSGTGQHAAAKAAALLQGRAKVVLPHFSDKQRQRHHQTSGKQPSDFNDLHLLEGIHAVNNMIAEQQQTQDHDTTPVARYEVNAGGVYFIGVQADRKTGETIEAAPQWLCDPLHLIGCGSDDAGNQHRLLRWQRQGSGETVTIAMPNADIGEREGWARLRGGGLTMTTERGAQGRLAMWLQRGGDQTWHHIVNMGGWQHGAFVLPSGEMIGTPDTPMFYNGKGKRDGAYSASCELTAWQQSVGRLAKGNPVAMVAIACALAGPIIRMSGSHDGIGVHLYTNTSSGKTTCASAAASVWGCPKRTLHTWSGTSLGLSNAAEACNDMLLCLDEIGGGDARKIAPAIYSMLNGKSKQQGAKDGGNRDDRSWVLGLVSTGEMRMSQFLSEGGQTPRGGQEVRLLDIPADSGRYRAFDELHGYANGEQFAVAMQEAASQHYGALGRQWVAWLSEHGDQVKDTIQTMQARLLAELPDDAAPTSRRGTRKFGVLCAAVAMTSRAGLTGWSEDEAIQGVSEAWRRWLADFGTEDRDDARLIEQALGVLLANQYGRFILLPMDDKEPCVSNLMGYRRCEADGLELFMVLPHAFKNEVIAGYELRRACEVLHKAGLLEYHVKTREWTRRVGNRIGRAYWMRSQRKNDSPTHYAHA